MKLHVRGDSVVTLAATLYYLDRTLACHSFAPLFIGGGIDVKWKIIWSS
jgi:hypothetical protein